MTFSEALDKELVESFKQFKRMLQIAFYWNQPCSSASSRIPTFFWLDTDLTLKNINSKLDYFFNATQFDTKLNNVLKMWRIKIVASQDYSIFVVVNRTHLLNLSIGILYKSTGLQHSLEGLAFCIQKITNAFSNAKN